MDEILNSGNIPYVSEASVSVEIETEDIPWARWSLIHQHMVF